MRFSRILRVLGTIAVVISGIYAQVEPMRTGKIAFATSGQTVQDAIVSFGATKGIPIGVVSEGSALCKAEPAGNYEADDPREALSNVLAVSAYTSNWVGTVLEVRPIQGVSPAAKRILTAGVARFGNQMDTTIHGLGIVLAGYIRGILHPDQGYAGEIISSTVDEKAPQFDLTETTTQGGADYLVSLGSKGVWFAFEDSASGGDFTIRAYSYKNDTAALAHLPCPMGHAIEK